jgi:DtxR family transcriptional regulator, Mn-dependent transcriptional regulator
MTERFLKMFVYTNFMISPTKEDYLRAISHLKAKKNGDVGVVELAGHMGLAKSTVSERIRELAQEGLVVYRRYSPMRLTRKGQETADRLDYKHRLIEVFLHDTLKIGKDDVHECADRLEHGFSDDAIERLRRFLNDPVTCPHGQRIVSRAGWTHGKRSE